MATVGIVITISIIILGLIGKKSSIIFGIQFFWIWMIQVFNCGGYDYSMNEYIYLSGGINTEWIASAVTKLFLSLGIEYMLYRVFWGTIAICILARFIWKYSKRPCWVTILYICFLWTDNVIQCRFFWGSCILLIAFEFLIKKKQKLFWLFCILATGFHTSFVIYLVFPVIYEFMKKNSRVKNIIILGFEIIVCLNFDLVFAVLGSNYLVDKLKSYLFTDNYSSIIIGIAFFVLYGTIVFTAHWIIQRNCKSNIDYVILNLLNASIFILPFLLYNSNFGRYFRPILILAIITVLNKLSVVKRNSLSKYFSYIFCMLLVIGGCVLQSVSGWFMIDNLFNNNYLLKLIF